VIEDCPQLIEKWKERGNQNQNIHMIEVKEFDDQPRITVVAHGRTRTREYVIEKRKGG
jgi:hypothetical protein